MCLVAIAVLGACTRDETSTVASTSATSAAPSTTAAPPTAAPTTSAATTVPPTTAAATTIPPTAAPTTAVTTPVTTPPPTTLPPFPASGADFSVTNETWAVVLAGSPDFDDPALATAVAAAEAAGYFTGATDCDVGAKQALGFSEDDTVYTISVYFLTEADARAAAAAFTARGIPAVAALLQVFCLD